MVQKGNDSKPWAGIPHFEAIIAFFVDSGVAHQDRAEGSLIINVIQTEESGSEQPLDECQLLSAGCCRGSAGGLRA